MKNILKSILVLGFFLTLMASCKKEEAAPELRVIETKLETGPLENIGTIQLSSADFTASVEDEWCKIQQEGDVIHIVVEQNAEKTNRSTLIHITSNAGAKLVVPVTQRGLLFEVNSQTNDLNYSFSGGLKKINIISNIDYQVKFDQDWLSAEVVGDTLYVKADPYKPSDVNARRTGTAHIIYGTEEVALEFAQFNILSFEDFLGQAFLSYIDDSSLDEAFRKRIPVTITAKVAGSVFTVITGPMEVFENRPIAFDVTYNADATIQINSGQLLLPEFVDARAKDIINNNKVKVFAAAYNIADKFFSSNTDPLLKAYGKPTDTHMNYTFEKFNEWTSGRKTYTADGLAISAYRFGSSIMSRYGLIPPYLYMMDMRIEK